MEIYLVKEFLNDKTGISNLDYCKPIEIEIMEKIAITDELGPINKWIDNYKQGNPLECPPYLVHDLYNLNNMGKIFWYTSWCALNFRYFFYDMAHIKNTIFLRELKLKALLDD